jgi:hypothetical protein
MPQGVTVDADPKDAAVHITGRKVVKPAKLTTTRSTGKSAAKAERKHPCTYNGLILDCKIPKPGGATGTLFTPGMAREAVMDIPLPGLELHVQPDGETLVNVRTNFWVEPETFETSIELLGHTIDIEATPASFTWVHGDGTSQTTREAGRPYPDLDITHRYLQPKSLAARVVTTYDVRYSIDGGGWTNLDEPLAAAGPETAIDVHEAIPVLAR